MSSNTGNKRARMTKLAKYISIVMSVILIVSVLVVLNVFSAVEKPVVTDASGLAYEDKGSSKISESVDVHISPAANSEYYYLLTDNLVDVYYDGETDNPAGSYFDGSLTNGDLVTSISQDPTSTSGIPIGADDNWTINIPKPEIGQRYELKVVSYSDGDKSPAFSHSFYARAPFAVTDGKSTTYDNNGKTGISDSIDVYITPAEDDDEYYYTFDELPPVDVYYDGETNNPVGSYFEGSLISGEYVASVSIDPDSIGMIRVNGETDWKITVPKPTAKYPSILKIVCKSGSVSTLIYTHNFVQPYIGSAEFGDSIEARFENSSTQSVSGQAFAAVYDAKGTLVAMESKEFEANAGGEALVNFSIELSKYPASDYNYRVLFWDAGFIPLTTAVEN